MHGFKKGSIICVGKGSCQINYVLLICVLSVFWNCHIIDHQVNMLILFWLAGST